MDNSILIKLIGGPLDGDVKRLLKPADAVVRIRSKMRHDVGYVYRFDDTPENCNFPLAFRFDSYERIKADNT